MEDLLKMGGESLLVETLVTLSTSNAPTPLLADSVVAVSTLYKNAISISDLSLCEKALGILMELSTSSDESLQRKSFFGINAIVSHFRPMAERFIEKDGIRLVEQGILSEDLERKKKALLLYSNLLAQFPTQPALSTSNVCSQAMQDLTSVEWESQYALVEAYLNLLQ